MQGEIAGAIVEKVRAAVTTAERTRLESARPVDPEAYDAYLKGMQHFYRMTAQEFEIALQYFELALQKDPNSARAYSGICMVWLGRSANGYVPPAEASPKARAAALKAIALDDALADAHVASGSVKYLMEYDWAGGEAELKRALELNPNNVEARSIYSGVLTLKNPTEALAQIQRVLEMDPLNFGHRYAYAQELQIAGRHDEAIAEFGKVLAAWPDVPFSHWGLAGVFFAKGMYEESFAEVKAYYGGDRELQAALAQGYAQAGYRGAMRRAADTLAARAHRSYVLPTDIARLYARAGGNSLNLFKT